MSATDSEDYAANGDEHSDHSNDDSEDYTSSDDSSEYETSSEDNSSDDDILVEHGKKELVCAAAQGLLDKVIHLIQACPDNVTGGVGCVALLNAAFKGHAAVVTSLLEAGAHVEACSSAGTTPLIAAARGGQVIIIELLLAAGANIAAADKKGFTALFHAVGLSKVEATQKLLKTAGAEVNGKDRTGQTPLFLAARNGNLQLIEILLQSGADVNFKRRIELFILPDVSAYGNIEDLLDCDKTPLAAAARNGHVKALQALLKAGALVDNGGDQTDTTALHFAARNGYIEVVRVLIDAGADLNSDLLGEGTTPLSLAVHQRHLNVVHELLAAGANPDGGFYHYEEQPDGSMVRTGHEETPLMLVSIEADPEVLQILIKAGANVSIVNKTGQSALSYAVCNSHIEIVAILLAAGADLLSKGQRDMQREGRWREASVEDDEIEVMLKDELKRRVVAALFSLPPSLPMHIRQYIISLALPVE